MTQMAVEIEVSPGDTRTSDFSPQWFAAETSMVDERALSATLLPFERRGVPDVSEFTKHHRFVLDALNGTPPDDDVDYSVLAPEDD